MNIIFDLDGTLANCEHRLRFIKGTGREGPYGKKDWVGFHEECINDLPIVPIIEVFARLDEHHNVKIWSGRNESVRVKTLCWLAQHMQSDWSEDHEAVMRNFDAKLTMRPKNDFRPDHIMKEEWLLALPKAEWPDLVFDDRKSVVDMWRRNGIRCAQVAPGEF